MDDKKGNYKSESVYSKKLRAGKRRTYFFDVKSTKANDYFLTITESKKRQDDTYERFKIFLYKEDFNKFLENLTETIDHIKKELMPHYDFDEFARRQEEYERNRQETNAQNESAPTSNPVAPESDDSPADKITGNPSGTDRLPNDDDLKW
ncbi:MAG: DUF3276 family protein [Chitinophagales bacterium]|nr:DUF3276 family protein [Chitinophagales bacterium]